MKKSEILTVKFDKEAKKEIYKQVEARGITLSHFIRSACSVYSDVWAEGPAIMQSSLEREDGLYWISPEGTFGEMTKPLMARYMTARSLPTMGQCERWDTEFQSMIEAVKALDGHIVAQWLDDKIVIRDFESMIKACRKLGIKYTDLLNDE